MIVEKFAQTILFEPPLKLDVNRVCILCGYATPNMASWFIKNVKTKKDCSIDVSLIVGMVPYDGISVSVHEGFVSLIKSELPKEVNTFRCSYIFNDPPVHSKIYIWMKNDQPVKAFMGSCNFTQSAFSDSRRELMVECDAKEAYQYYCKAESDSIFCNHGEIEEYVMIHATHAILDEENNLTQNIENSGIESVKLSLLDSRTKETHLRSGLNWGHRTSKSVLKDGTVKHRERNKNEAYIPLPAYIARSGFFPLNEKHFTVITDDKHLLILRVEQQQDKAITTPLSNAQLGEYFRNRLGLANGEFITKKNLEKYGRTDVTFYKFDEEQYYMDFSV